MAIITGTTLGEDLFGTGADDDIFGLGGNDTIHGREGSDRINGGTGADVMRGRSGNDVYIIDDSGDLAVERVGEGTVGSIPASATGWVPISKT